MNEEEIKDGVEISGESEINIIRTSSTDVKT